MGCISGCWSVRVCQSSTDSVIHMLPSPCWAHPGQRAHIHTLCIHTHTHTHTHTLTLSTAFCRSEAKKTKVKRKTNNPQFDEVFYFEVKPECSVGTSLNYLALEEEHLCTI